MARVGSHGQPASEESYDVVLRRFAPGEQTLAAYAAISFDNLAAAKLTFTSPARSP